MCSVHNIVQGIGVFSSAFFRMSACNMIRLDGQSEFGFAFIPVNGDGRTKGASNRGLVRSHCMRGKNRTIGVPRQSLSRRHLAAHQLINPNVVCTTSDSRLQHSRQTHCSGTLRVSVWNDTNASACDRPEHQLPILSFPSTTSTLQFVFDIDHNSKSLIFQCEQYDIP